jgi:hypothetical protein
MKYWDIDTSLNQIKKQFNRGAIDIIHNGDDAAHLMRLNLIYLFVY